MQNLVFIQPKGLDESYALNKINSCFWKTYLVNVTTEDNLSCIRADSTVWLLRPSQDLVDKIHLREYRYLYILTDKDILIDTDNDKDSCVILSELSLFGMACAYAQAMADRHVKGYNRIDVKGLSHFNTRLDKALTLPEKYANDYLSGAGNYEGSDLFGYNMYPVLPGQPYVLQSIEVKTCKNAGASIKKFVDFLLKPQGCTDTYNTDIPPRFISGDNITCICKCGDYTVTTVKKPFEGIHIDGWEKIGRHLYKTWRIKSQPSS